jgi:hypothetical protein
VRLGSPTPRGCLGGRRLAVDRLVCVVFLGVVGLKPPHEVRLVLISKTRPPYPERVSVPPLGGTGDTPSGLTY